MKSKKKQLWKTIQVGNEYTLQIPQEAEYSYEEDGATLTVALPTSPRTEVLIGRFPFWEERTEFTRRASMRANVIKFCSEIIPRVTKLPIGFTGDAEEVESSEEGRVTFQGLVWLPENCWWLVRTHASLRDGHFYLLHWNGHERHLKIPAFAILHSFKLCPSRAERK